MSSLLFIDPGKHACAYARFHDKTLYAVDYRSPFTWVHTPDRIFVELPQQRGRRSRVKMSDLIELAFVGGQASRRGADDRDASGGCDRLADHAPTPGDQEETPGPQGAPWDR